MNWPHYLYVVVLAGIAGSFTDWVFAGLLFHDRYQAHPEVWRQVRNSNLRIAISSLIGAFASAAFAYLLIRAGGLRLDHALAWAVLVWLAGPAPLLVINGQWLKIHPLVTASHALGWLARFAVTAALAAWLL